MSGEGQLELRNPQGGEQSHRQQQSYTKLGIRQIHPLVRSVVASAVKARDMEDVQPNEFRMSRKGSTRVPTVRSSHRVTSWRGYRGRGQSRRSSEDNSARGSQPWHGPAPSRQCLTTKPPPPLPSRERHSYDRGSMYRAEIAPHFDQPPRRAEAGAVSVPPVSFQQDFSSLGEPRRSLKQPDIKSSVNSSQRDLTKDHSLRRAIHAPPHEVGRNNDFNETQTHPAVYSPPTIQPECCPPQTAK
ncbi:hypothetical protein EDD16DRAFT_1090466 [Pisolithus croceorrhizus]|nr:hypothetical protein EDD16DRAFT_1090466 [Pisolithus croceorrhizus]